MKCKGTLLTVAIGLGVTLAVALLVVLAHHPPAAMANGTVSISEIRIDQPDTDNDEYFELSGSAGTSLDGLTYLVIGDGTGGSGVIEAVIDLTGTVIPADGYFLVVESTYSLGGSPDMTTSLNFENSDNVTHMLVQNFTGSDGDDLDTDDDGTLDVTPWTSVVDCVALIETVGSGDLVYCSTTVGPDGSYVPAHVYRCTAGWTIGSFSTGVVDTPGTANSFCRADLQVDKTGPTLVPPGDIISYTITYANVGTEPASNVVLSDTLPPGVSYLTDTSGLSCPACTPGATGVLTWSVGSLSYTLSHSFTLVALIPSTATYGASLTNTVAITTTDAEVTTTNNLDEWAVAITPLVDVAVAKTGPAYGVVGQSLVYSITLENRGILTATDVVLTDTLPVSTTYDSDDSGVTPTCAVGVCVWSFGDVPSGTLYTFNLTVTVDSGVVAGTILTNAVTASTSVTDDISTNNTDQWTTAVYPLVSLHDIQYVDDPATDDSSPYRDQTVWAEGVVVAGTDEIGYSNNNFVIENPAGGAWNGLMVYNGGAFPDVSEGDYVRVLGRVAEYYGMTELDISSAPNALEVISTSNPLPAPAVITTGAFVDAATAEQWESVLIEFQDATVTNPSLGYGEWAFNDGTGATRADDFGGNDGDLTYTPALNDYYRFIRGIGWYSYGNYKLEPRYDADIDLDYPVIFVYSDLEDVVHAGESVYLAGDFNGWNTTALSLTANADSSVFSTTYTFDVTGTYQYRYVVYTGTVGVNPQQDWLNKENRWVTVTRSFQVVNDFRNVVVDWARLQGPDALTVTLGQSTGDVSGQVYIQSVTNLPGEGRGIRAQVGYGTDPDPANWTWFPMGYNADDGNNDGFTGAMIPTAPGVYSYAVRFEGNWGPANPNAGWAYGDLDGYAPSGDPFELSQCGVLTVNGPDLSGFKEVTPTIGVRPGDLLTYTVYLTNTADTWVITAHVTLTDTFPPGFEIITPTLPPGMGYISSTRAVTWTGDIAPGASLTLVIRVRIPPVNVIPPGGYTFTNTVQVDDGYGNTMDISSSSVTVTSYRMYLPIIARRWSP